MTGSGVTPEVSSRQRVGCVVSWLLTGDVTSASLFGRSSSVACGGASVVVLRLHLLRR